MEADSNVTFIKLPEDVSVMGIVVQVSKLHIISCIHHFKYLSEMKFIENIDQDLERYVLVIDYVQQDSFNC